MRVLFLHQNFPGQFVHLARALSADPRHDVRAVTEAGNARPDLVRTVRYAYASKLSAQVHPLARNFADRVARGEAVAGALQALRAEGFVPDVVVGHLGWGETLFVKDIWPVTKLIVYAEYFYAAEGGDAGFDREFQTATDLETRLTVKAKNAAILLALNDADFGVAPTRFQGSRYPKELLGKIAILHEGIETDVVCPNPAAQFVVKPAGLTLTARDEVITFVNRELEPHRGYHIFMRALPEILAARPRAQVVIVGGDQNGYSGPAPNGRSWKQIFLDEVKDRLPLERVHFTGKVPYSDFIALMQISSVHVYLTYPFVLSWSMLEAMSAGALVVASRTPPVEEVIEDGKTGLLFDFFDGAGLAERVIAALASPQEFAGVRGAARRSMIERYDLKRVWLPRWLRFIETVGEG